MKNILILLTAVLPAMAQQKFDIKLLDKLGANAKSSTNITLDGPMLKLASGILGSDKDGAAVKSLVANLNAIYVRTFEFAEAGKYNGADLEPLRAFLDSGHWSKIVDVKDSGETSEIYVGPQTDGSPGGFAIISSEPKEVTVVYIDGRLNMDDLSKLSGTMGIPDMTFMNDGKTKPGARPEPKGGKKEE